MIESGFEPRPENFSGHALNQHAVLSLRKRVIFLFILFPTGTEIFFLTKINISTCFILIDAGRR